MLVASLTLLAPLMSRVLIAAVVWAVTAPVILTLLDDVTVPKVVPPDESTFALASEL